ncbi:MAG: DUF1565 domain-containing protein, partial [Chloroflexota bacterium]|nr:DUF1565 domain-containing protein [Chloroflexota bacterium]
MKKQARFLMLAGLFLLILINGVVFITKANSFQSTVAYAQGEPTPEPLPPVDLAQLQELWEAQSYWRAAPDPERLFRTLPAAPSARRQADPAAAPEARVIWVYIDAAPGGDGSEANPFTAIQPALDVAVAGDLIVVRPGVYPSSQLVMKEGVDLIGAVEGDPAQVTIQGSSDTTLVCATNSVLQDVTVVATVASANAIIRCQNSAPLFNRIIVEQADRVALQLVGAGAASATG